MRKVLTAFALLAVGCSNEAQQQLEDAQRELGDVQDKLREAGREMEDVTKELAKAAKVSKKDLERELRDAARAAHEASKDMPRPVAPRPKPGLKAEGRIHCEAETCTVERSVIEEIEQKPQLLLQEGLVVPVSGPPAGLKLEALREGGLAAQLGLRNGDVLTAVNDHAVSSVQDLIALPGHAEPQEELVLTLSRAGKQLHVRVRLAPAPEPTARPEP